MNPNNCECVGTTGAGSGEPECGNIRTVANWTDEQLVMYAIDRAVHDIAGDIRDYTRLIQEQLKLYNNDCFEVVEDHAQTIVHLVAERNRLEQLRHRQIVVANRADTNTPDWQPCECSGCQEPTQDEWDTIDGKAYRRYANEAMSESKPANDDLW